LSAFNTSDSKLESVISTVFWDITYSPIYLEIRV
jgi:hypothetical protein